MTNKAALTGFLEKEPVFENLAPDLLRANSHPRG